MKYATMLGMGMLLVTAPVQAMMVTNLDNQPHRVELSGEGGREVRTIAPGDTENFIGKPQGTLSLLSAEEPKPNRGTLHADGMLSGVIGAERSEEIPADSLDNFVIWPGGHLGIQERMKNRNRN